MPILRLATRRSLHLVCCVITAGVLSACNSSSEPESNKAGEDTASEVETGTVLAHVNGVAITDEEVQATIDRTFSSAEMMVANEDLDKKVLESLIAAKAMRQQAEKSLSADEVKRIRQQTAAYEEELFVKAYLRDQVEPQPVTAAQVEAYYQANPERFGTTPVRDFELLKAPANQDDAQRKQLLTALSDIRAAQAWDKQAPQWQQDFALQYQPVKASQAGLLAKPLEDALGRLAEVETSDAIYLDGQLHLVRLNKVTASAPKPLSAVSSEIRQTLAPMQLREAVKKASEQARAQADVRYAGQ